MADPDGELRPGHGEGPAATGAPVVGAHLHGEAVPDDGRIQARPRPADLDLRCGVDARVAPEAAELQDLLPDLGPSDVVVVEDAGHTGVREVEGVGAGHLIVVAEGATYDSQLVRVVVVDKRHGAGRIPAQNTAEAATLVELRKVVGVDASLQHVVRREVVHRHAALALADVVVQAVGVAVPVLRHGEGRASCSHVVPLEVGRVALHEIEAQGTEAHILHHVPDVCVDILADLLIGVVHARRVLRDLHPRAPRAAATRHGRAVVADGPTLPVGLLELQPASRGVLCGCTAVVHYDVEDGAHLLLVHGGDEALQRRRVAVLVVQDVPLPGEIAMLVHRVRGRGKPHHVHACRAELRQQAQEDAVPTVRLAGAPIEGLEHDHALLLAQARRVEERHRPDLHRVACRADDVWLHAFQEARAAALHQAILLQLARAVGTQLHCAHLVGVGLAHRHAGVGPLQSILEPCKL
mmetsp:Transcript_102327/g.315759  ORF Transcript_102327/g.315759 Transcript_102327/m.315759 type:complete len:466 (-) Transcript_102327:1966-3363(-)